MAVSHVGFQASYSIQGLLRTPKGLRLDSQTLKASITSIHRWSKRWAKRSFPSWNITNEAVGFTSEYRVFGRMLHTAGHQVSGDRVCSVWWSLTMVTAKEAIGKRREIFLSKANFLYFDVCEKGRGLIISLLLRFARFWIKKITTLSSTLILYIHICGKYHAYYVSGK